jgi:hypothetical protein
MTLTPPFREVDALHLILSYLILKLIKIPQFLEGIRWLLRLYMCDLKQAVPPLRISLPAVNTTGAVAGGAFSG